MALVDLWSSSRDQLEDKHVQQIISFAGSGQLKDDNPTSREFRDFLALIPSSLLQKYAEQCLQDSFTGSGFALQNIVNQITNARNILLDTVFCYRGYQAQLYVSNTKSHWVYRHTYCVF